MVMPYHLHMPSYFLETFTEYPCFADILSADSLYSLWYIFLELSECEACIIRFQN